MLSRDRRRAASGPVRKNCLHLDGLDLLRETLVIDGEQRVVSCIRRTSQRVGDENDTIAEIDRSKHRRHNTHIGFTAGDDQRVDLAFHQKGQWDGAPKPRISPISYASCSSDYRSCNAPEE